MNLSHIDTWMYLCFFIVLTLPSIIVFPDYAPVDTTISIPIGAQEGSLYCIPVTVIDDDILETTEQFFLDLVTITPDSLTVEVDRAIKTVTILDNERKTSTPTD